MPYIPGRARASAFLSRKKPWKPSVEIGVNRNDYAGGSPERGAYNLPEPMSDIGTHPLPTAARQAECKGIAILQAFLEDWTVIMFGRRVRLPCFAAGLRRKAPPGPS